MIDCAKLTMKMLAVIYDRLQQAEGLLPILEHASPKPAIGTYSVQLHLHLPSFGGQSAQQCIPLSVYSSTSPLSIPSDSIRLNCQMNASLKVQNIHAISIGNDCKALKTQRRLVAYHGCPK